MQTIAGLLLLISCALWGSSGDSDRFNIGQSYFYSNSNELALGLTTTMGFFLYLLVQKNVGKWLLGAVAFLADVYFLLKTGSRGGLVAMGAVIAFSLFFSSRYRSRLLVMVVFLPVLVVAIPPDTLHRLTFIFADPVTAGVRTESDEAAVQSQIERTELFWKSVHLMITHPLLGVGVGEFPDAVYASDLENHTRSPALGTHNSYTQVGAECGIPSLIVYLLIVFTGIRMNYRIFRRTLSDERLAFFPLAALCLLTSSLGFAIGSTFHHVAWSGTLPMLTGATAGLWQACQKEAAKVGSPNLLTEQNS
jgi:O-antigen ligase